MIEAKEAEKVLWLHHIPDGAFITEVAMLENGALRICHKGFCIVKTPEAWHAQSSLGTGTAQPLEYATSLLRMARCDVPDVPGETGALCRAIDAFLNTGVVPGNVKAVPVANYSRWIPVSERLPEIGVEVLVTGWEYGSKESTGERFYNIAWKERGMSTEWSSRAIGPIVAPTHWMPLPTSSPDDAAENSRVATANTLAGDGTNSVLVAGKEST